MECLRAQGATEYLVLLAVVLIVALVSVALLGFFPGMASDAQITQSQTYWQSATPVAILETGAKMRAADGVKSVYLRVKNNAAYPIRITGIVGGDGGKATNFYGGNCGSVAGTNNISDFFYLGPGEEREFEDDAFRPAGGCTRQVILNTGTSITMTVGGATALCQNSTSSPGTVVINNFGFEYITYIDGQQVTKREIGKPLIIKCLPPY